MSVPVYIPDKQPATGSPKNAYLKPDERFDDLQLKGYEIIQNPRGFCFGMDAVLLSSFIRIKPGEQVIDLCTGTGILPILMAAKTKASHIYGLDIQEYSIDMSARSVLYNGLNDRISFVHGDVKNARNFFGAGCYDVITCNPPYMRAEHGMQNDTAPKAIARHELLCTLDDVLRESAGLLKASGRLYMVHRPFRLPEIFDAMRRYKLEPKTMQLVYPFVNKEPNMVLIEGRKDGKPELKNLPPIIVYNSPGIYTDQILEIYHMKTTDSTICQPPLRSTKAATLSGSDAGNNMED